MHRLKPCWSCGAEDTPCDPFACECAACINPEGLTEGEHAEDYENWLHENTELGGSD